MNDGINCRGELFTDSAEKYESDTAKDKKTNKEQSIRIQASGGLSDDDIKKMTEEAEQFKNEIARTADERQSGPEG